MTERIRERIGIVGSGAIGCGLARLAGPSEVIVWARSEASADTAREEIGDGARVVTDLAELRDCTFVIESVIEDLDAKSGLFGKLRLADDAIIATTTSSLSVEELAGASGRPSHFVGLHVFNPVEKMPLVELVFPAAADDDVRTRSAALCEATSNARSSTALSGL